MSDITAQNLEAAITAITTKRSLYDVTIICTTDDFQAEYWIKRLSEGICKREETCSSSFPMVLAVSEDWSAGGAGNGLGTLYAYQKACLQAKDKHNVDLAELLKNNEVSIALYHTAGKGTRLAPLPASENNNKPAVKLPVCHELSDGSFEPITVLEAVIKQTGIYASSRKGRLSVFWGDQVFIPSAAFEYKPTHHADIMCTLLGDTAPTAEEWAEKGLDKYGVIAVSKGEEKNAAQVEKVDHSTAVEMLKVLGDIGQVGPSLGSFSVSAALLHALCDEYSVEISTKQGKFDTDPHFWMPLTLPEADYVKLMSQKGVDEKESVAHHKRMGKMKESFPLDGMGLFGAVDVGNDGCWWDYGLVKLYFANNMKFTDRDDSDADLLRRFFSVTANQINSSLGSELTVDEKSCISSSSITSGTINESVVSCVNTKEAQIDGAIVVNCTAKKIVAGKNCILYNLVDDSDEGIVAKPGDIMVLVTEESGEMMKLNSKYSICGGKAWKEVVEGNTLSFEDVHKTNQNANVTAIEEKKKEIFKKVSSSLN